MPGLLFADDIVLMSHKWSHLRELLQTVSSFGDEMGLTFNPAKSAIVEFAKTGEEQVRLEIQGHQIPVSNSYKYLGIILGGDKNYLQEQEVAWEQKAKNRLLQMHAKSLWGFSRFEISKIQWKSTAVPALTYANSSTAM